MKRTISHEATVTAARLRELAARQGFVLGGGALDPLTVLGLGADARWPDVRQAYIARLRVYHPEQHPQEFMKVVDAYDALKRFLVSMPGAAASSASEESCSGGPGKRRRVDAAGASLPSAGAVGPTFAGLQECWPMVATPAPVIALDPSGVGHIGHREPSAQGTPLHGIGHVTVFPSSSASSAPLPFGQGFGNSTGLAAQACGMDDEDGDCLTRSVSNHMGSGVGSSGYGGATFGQPTNRPNSRQASFFGDRGDSGMMIG